MNPTCRTDRSRSRRRLGVGVGMAALSLAALALPAPAAEAATVAPSSRTFSYTGNEQTFVVPAHVTLLHVTAVGGAGAPGAYSSVPGHGARVTTSLTVTPGQTLYVEVGGNGHLSGASFNGGGAGGVTPGCDTNGGAGGGATDIRTSPRGTAGSEATRLVVAGGGGGGGGGASTMAYAQGGAGGSADNWGEYGFGTDYGWGGEPGATSTGSGDAGEATVCPKASGGGGGGGLHGGAGGEAATGVESGGGGGGGGTSLVAGGTRTTDSTGVPLVTLTWDPTAPTVALSSPTATWTVASSTTVTWSASDSGGSGLARFQVRTRRAAYNGTFSAGSYPAGWQALSATSRTLTAPLAPGYTSCYAVRAFDHAGNVSAWSAQRCTRAPLDDRQLARSAGWTVASSSTAYKATLTRTSVHGSRLTRSGGEVARVALVAVKCPTCGSVTLKVGSTVIGSRSLYASTTRPRQVITFPAFSRRSATVTVTVTSSGKAVPIDGLGISRM